jgi:hypothetical protein
MLLEFEKINNRKSGDCCEFGRSPNLTEAKAAAALRDDDYYSCASSGGGGIDVSSSAVVSMDRARGTLALPACCSAVM